MHYVSHPSLNNKSQGPFNNGLASLRGLLSTRPQPAPTPRAAPVQEPAVTPTPRPAPAHEPAAKPVQADLPFSPSLPSPPPRKRSRELGMAIRQLMAVTAAQ
jgi:hypothetical protein